MRVLVVEDEIKMASLIRRGLRSEGLERVRPLIRELLDLVPLALDDR